MPATTSEELFACRVGFSVCRGTGWILPVIQFADWPLGRLAITKSAFIVSVPVIFNPLPIEFTSITSVSRLWFGLRIAFQRDDEHYEADLRSLFLVSRIEACVKQHQLPLNLP